MDVIYKIFNRVVSLLTIIKYKIFYGKKFRCSLKNRVDGSLSVRISRGGYVSIGKGTSIRKNCVLNANSGAINIGENCFLNDFVCVNSRKKVFIKNGCILGQFVKIYDHDHDYKSHDMVNNFICEDVIIGENTWLGSDVIILKGSEIGSNCVIGAKSLVKQRIDDSVLYYARVKPVIERIELYSGEEEFVEKNQG